MPKPVNVERDSKIARLWNEPRSSNSIARELGITRGMVTSAVTRMRRQGVPLRAAHIPSQVALNKGASPLGFDENHEVGASRSSVKRSHRAEGRNWVD